MRGALARSSSAASGFFFCGMIDEPLDQASDSTHEAELLARPQHELGAEAREVRRAGRAGAEVVEDEVAVGDRVDRVRRHAGEAELARRPCARSVAKFTPGQRAGAERQQRRLLERRSASARGRARASRRRRAGGGRGRRAARAAGACSPAAPSRGARSATSTSVAMQRLDAPSTRRGAASRGEQRDVGRDLVVARARGVQLAADRPGELGEPPLDRHVDVLVVRPRTGTCPSRELGLDRVEAGEQRVAVGGGDDALRREHAGVGAGLRDVVRPQAAVEGQRGVERLEGGVLGLGEARHVRRILRSAAAGPAPRGAGQECERVDLRDLRGEAEAEQVRGSRPSRARRRSRARWKRRSRSRRSASGDRDEAREPEHHAAPTAPSSATSSAEAVGRSRRSAMSAITRCQSTSGSATAPAKPAAPTRRARRRARSSRPSGLPAMRASSPVQHAAPSAGADLLDLVLAHRREERQRHRPRGDVLADRELARAVAEGLAVEATSGGSPAGTAWTARRARAARGDLVAVAAARDLDDEDEPAADVAARVRARQPEAARSTRPAPRGSSRRPARGRRACPSRRSSWAMPIAQASRSGGS